MTTDPESEPKKTLEEEEKTMNPEEKTDQKTDQESMKSLLKESQFKESQFKEIKRPSKRLIQDSFKRNPKTNKILNIIEFIFVTLNGIGLTKKIETSDSKKLSSIVKMIRDSKRRHDHLFTTLFLRQIACLNRLNQILCQVLDSFIERIMSGLMFGLIIAMNIRIIMIEFWSSVFQFDIENELLNFFWLEFSIEDFKILHKAPLVNINKML